MSTSTSSSSCASTLAMAFAAVALSFAAGASEASAQCNPANRVSQLHVPADPPPQDRINEITSRLLSEPQLYDLLGCPVDYFGTSKNGGAFINFDRGALYAAPWRRAYEIHGAIREKWGEYEWEHGLLGYPTSDELAWHGNAGRYSKFEGGVIIWTPDNGAHAVYGAIGDAHRAGIGRLAPTTEEFTSKGGNNSCPKGQRQQNFANLDRVLEPKRACWDANTGRVTWVIHQFDFGDIDPGIGGWQPGGV